MNQLPLHEEMLTRNISSIFQDGAKIEGNNTGEIFSLLRRVFVEMWEKSWDRLYVKHMNLQNILVQYTQAEPLDIYLENTWYTLFHIFHSLEELSQYLELNSSLRGDIKSGRYHIWLFYVGLTPTALVLAQPNGRQPIEDIWLTSKISVDDIIWFPNI